MMYLNGEIKPMNEELEKYSKFDNGVQIYTAKNDGGKARVLKNYVFSKITEMDKNKYMNLCIISVS